MLKIICDKCQKEINKINGKLRKGSGVQIGKNHYCTDCICVSFKIEVPKMINIKTPLDSAK